MRRIAAPPSAAAFRPIVTLLAGILGLLGILWLLVGGAAAPAGAVTAPLAAPPGVTAPAAVAPAGVLVNQPASEVCVGRTFQIGVWYQRSGGSRAYRVVVNSPRRQRVFFRDGQAPSAHWAFWRIRAKMAGTYHTVYSGHWRSRSRWTRYAVRTRARRC